MKRFLGLIALFMGLALGPAVEAQRAPAGFTGLPLIGDLVFDAGGLSTGYLTGAWVKAASVSGNTLTIQVVGSDNVERPVTFTPSGGGGTADGVLATATFNPATETITLTTTAPSSQTFNLDLSGFITLAEIADWAEQGNSDTIPDAKIPAAIARDSELPTPRTDTEIDSRIATYGRISPSGQIADAQIPAAITRDSEVFDWAEEGNTQLVPTAKLGGGTADTTTFLRGDGSWTVTGGGGGGGTPATPVVFLAAMAIAEQANVTPVEVTLTQDLADGYLLSFFNASANPGSYAVLESDDLLDRAEFSTTPGLSAAGGITLKTGNPGDTGFGHSSILVWNSDEANKIWVANGRTALMTLTITGFPRAAQGVAGVAGAAGSAGATGAVGADGAAGPQGLRGFAGVQGQTGPAGADGTSDGVVTAGTVAGTTLTLDRSIGSDVVITGLPSGGAADGVISAFTPAEDGTATITRSIGTDLDVTGLAKHIVVPDTNGNLRATTAADVSRVAIDHTNLRVGTREVVGTVRPAVTFVDYTAASFRGIRSYCAGTPNPVDGNRCYSTANGAWYRYAQDHWTNFSASPVGWRGAFTTEDEAENAISAIGQIAFIIPTSRMVFVTAFTPGSTVYEYHWEPEQERQELLTRPVLPDPASTNVGQFARVNAAGTAYETAVPSIDVNDEGSSVATDRVALNCVGTGITCLPATNSTAILRVNATYRGAWSALNLPYDQGQIVAHAGTIWIAAEDSPPAAPSYSAGNGWLHLSPSAYFRGEALAAATPYRSGEFVTVSGAVYMVSADVTLTAAQFAASASTIAIVGGGADEIYVVPPADLTLVSNNVNAMAWANTPPLSNGLVFHFVPEAANTGATLITIGGTDYGIVKAGEAGGFEALEGGELEIDIPTQLTYHGAAFYWTGALLGSAAQRDVGTDQHELAPLLADGRFDADRIPVFANLPVGGTTPLDSLRVGENDFNVPYIVGATLSENADELTIGRHGESSVVISGFNRAEQIHETIPFTYGIALGSNVTEGNALNLQGNIYQALTDIDIREVRVKVRPADDVNLRAYICVLSFYDETTEVARCRADILWRLAVDGTLDVALLSGTTHTLRLSFHRNNGDPVDSGGPSHLALSQNERFAIFVHAVVGTLPGIFVRPGDDGNSSITGRPIPHPTIDFTARVAVNLSRCRGTKHDE